MIYGYIAYLEGVPFYVGIGLRNRYRHVINGSHNSYVNDYVKGRETKVTFKHFKFENADVACDWEERTIKQIGRKRLPCGFALHLRYL